jgi:hypothetical protein
VTAIQGGLTWHAETLVEPGCPTYNGDGAGTEDAYSPGGDPLCPSWGSDAPQGHFGGSGWIPAICSQRSLMAMYSIYLGVDHHGSLGKVVPVNFAEEGGAGVVGSIEHEAIRKLNPARYLGDGGLAPSAAAVVDRVFEQIIISVNVDRGPNGIGSARAARVLPLQPL